MKAEGNCQQHVHITKKNQKTKNPEDVLQMDENDTRWKI